MGKCYDNPEYDNQYNDIQNTWKKILEEAALKFSEQFLNNGDNSEFESQAAYLGFISGNEWQQEQDNKVIKDLKNRLDIVNESSENAIKLVEELQGKMYSEEDMAELWQYVVDGAKEIMLGSKTSIGGFEEYIENFKKK